MYEAMARRYRPSTFAEVVGQEHVARTLRNAIEQERVVHAYLFCGPHGCGKTSMARIFASALVCENGPTPTPCGSCSLCRDIHRGRDVDVQEIDGASNNGVEEVRQLREQAGYVPTRARYKIYIIDEVHMLSDAAFNALLKTLEEPPGHVKFILCTTDPHRLPETVRSRTQRFDFRLVPPPALVPYFRELAGREEADVEPAAIEAVAAFAGGSVRDGLVLLDQLLSYADGTATAADVERLRGVAGAESVAGIYEAIQRRDLPAALAVVDEIARIGVNVGDFLDQLIDFGRDLMTFVATGDAENVSAYGPARAALERLAEEVSLDEALLRLDVFVEARVRVRSRALTHPLVPLEMAVARLAGLDDLQPVGAILDRLDAFAKGAPLPPARHEAPRGHGSAPAQPPTPPSASSPSSAPSPAPPAPTPPPADAPPRPAAETEPETGGAAAPPAETDATAPDTGTRNEATPPSADEASAPWAGGYGASPAALSLEAARRGWPAVQDRIRETNPPLMAFLKDVEVEAVEGGELVLAVPGGGSFLFEKLEDPKRKAKIAEAATEILGAPVTIRLSLQGPMLSEGKAAAPDAPPEPSAEVRARREAQTDPVVRGIVERFQGQVVNIEDENADGRR